MNAYSRKKPDCLDLGPSFQRGANGLFLPVSTEDEEGVRSNRSSLGNTRKVSKTPQAAFDVRRFPLTVAESQPSFPFPLPESANERARSGCGDGL